ncbi:MAG: acylneuraminate cytidylyltransferase family protein [Lachnospiraceae bacterium]|nr:acylneuraminate cytidylyltransferase family protein [Lachnospiraceae bacterium]
MNILFTICARAGSKGVRGKNVRCFCGIPLVYYTVAAFEEYKTKYGLADKIHLAVNTDSELLIEQLNSIETEYVLIERKESLAGDVIAKKDVIKDTLLEMEQLKGTAYDTVVDLDLTSPLRTAEDINGTLQTLLEDIDADISYSVTEARRSPYFNMVSENENGYYTTVLPSAFVARQQTPACYDMNASIYAYRKEYLLSSRLNDRKALIWVMRDTGILDIDSEEDLKLMEVIAQYLFTEIPEYGFMLEKIKNYHSK